MRLSFFVCAGGASQSAVNLHSPDNQTSTRAGQLSEQPLIILVYFMNIPTDMKYRQSCISAFGFAYFSRAKIPFDSQPPYRLLILQP
jgi:hypothetical protein